VNERDYLGDPGIDGIVILSWIFRKWNMGGLDWIDVAQGRERWWVSLNAVMNFQVA
jgi:hypothetical protein